MDSPTFTIRLQFEYTVVDEVELRAEARRHGLSQEASLEQVLGWLVEMRSKEFRQAAILPGVKVPTPMYQKQGNAFWARFFPED